MKNVFKTISTTPKKNVNKKKIQEETKKYIQIIREKQHILYAQNKHSLLIILQGTDCSGKDGATKAIFSSVNPQGVSVTSFKKPTDLERSYDFMWRIHKEVPAKGMIKIFNRSHYEDVLVPMANRTIEQKEAHRRFNHINDFEKLLEENGTIVLKFYLHISQEEQSKRFEERLTDPMKNWKFNPSDTETAKQWPEYRMAYANVFTHCNATPWHIIPSDKNWYKEYLIAKKIAKTLTDLDLKFPNLAK
jgi:PPK2 family polyphosphate:nucleotide phosphotransferase